MLGCEVVTATYNSQGGLPATLGGESPYVSAAGYPALAHRTGNALGQRNLLDTGPAGGAQTIYPHYGEAGASPPGAYPNLPSFRLMEIQAVDGSGQPKLHLQYAYDPGGNVQALWDQYGKEGTPEAWTYSFDFLDPLTGASGSYAAAYQYTPIGNMTSKTEEGTTYAMAYDDPNHAHAPSSVNSQLLQHDDNGNMALRTVDPAQDAGLRGETYTQTWDYENRLVGVVSGTLTITFTYDDGGALVKKEADGGDDPLRRPALREGCHQRRDDAVLLFRPPCGDRRTAGCHAAGRCAILHCGRPPGDDERGLRFQREPAQPERT